MKHSHSFIKTVTLKMALQLSLLVINVITIPLIIKNLGAFNFGILSFLKLFNHEGLFSYLEFGMQTILSKKSAEKNNDEDLNLVFSTFIVVGLFFSFLLSIALLVFKYGILDFFKLTPSEALKIQDLLKYGLISGIISIPYYLCVGILEGNHRFNFVNIVDFLLSFTTALAFLLCTFFNVQVKYFVISEVIVVSSIMIFTIIATFRNNLDLKQSRYFDINILKNNKHQILNLSNVKLTSLLFHNSDKLIISFFFGPTMLGVFEILLKIPKIIKGFGAPVSQMLLPLAASNSNNEQYDLRKITQYSIICSLIISFTCTSGVMFFAKDIFYHFLNIPFTLNNYLIFCFLLAWCSMTPLTQLWNVFIATNKILTFYTHTIYLSLFSKVITMSLSTFLGNSMLGLAYLVSILVQIPSFVRISLKINIDLLFFLKSIFKIIFSLLITLVISKCVFSINKIVGPINTLLAIISWGVLMSSISFILIFKELRLKLSLIFRRSV